MHFGIKELKQVTDEEKQEYKIYLQTKEPQHEIKYRKLRVEVKKLTRRVPRSYWDKYVRTLEHQLTGPKRKVFKY
jgi:hypothetical protein